MANKTKSPKNRPSLADDIFASLNEARDYFAGKKTAAILHRVIVRHSDGREARVKLGLPEHDSKNRANGRLPRHRKK